MTQAREAFRSAEPAIRGAVDAVLAGSAGAPVRALFDRLAEAVRDRHPDDWENRLERLWQLSLRAGEVWDSEDSVDALEAALHVFADALVASGFAVDARADTAPGDDSPCASSTPSPLDALAAAQGVRPVQDIAEFAFPEWPAAETADDFVATVRAWREGREGPSSR